jgi:hypothetical protein
MQAGQKHFINPVLKAPNVVEVDIDLAVLHEMQALLAEVLSSPSKLLDGCILDSTVPLWVMRPKWGSDIRWISQHTVEGYRLFKLAFDRLGVADHVARYIDLDKAIVLYSGFFVVRQECNELDFHRDWVKANNNAFTFLTPLTENAGELGLAYRNVFGEVCEYAYTMGKGIIFGDHFLHSTNVGKASSPIGLLCFTFGTDKMEHWEPISTTAAQQGSMYRQPDGQFIWMDASSNN